MRKILNGKTTYQGMPARITCEITDVDGYISITGHIIPYRCRTWLCAGCIHDEIAEAFPQLRKWLWLHLVSVDGSTMHEIANSLYHLANGNEEAAQRTLLCTDEEIREISAFVRYGLHRHPTHWYYDYDKKTKVYTIDGEDSKKLYENFISKYHFAERRKKAIAEFYEFVNTL